MSSFARRFRRKCALALPATASTIFLLVAAQDGGTVSPEEIIGNFVSLLKEKSEEVSRGFEQFGTDVLQDKLRSYVVGSVSKLTETSAEMEVAITELKSKEGQATIEEAEIVARYEKAISKLETARDKFTEVFAGVSNEDLGSSAKAAETEKMMSVFDKILELVSAEPGAGEMRGVITQMISDMDNDSQESAEKAAKTQALLGTAVKEMQGQISTLTTQIDDLMQRKYDTLFEKQRVQNELKIGKDIQKLYQENNQIFKTLEAAQDQMAQDNEARRKSFTESAEPIFSQIVKIDLFEQCYESLAGKTSTDSTNSATGTTMPSDTTMPPGATGTNTMPGTTTATSPSTSTTTSGTTDTKVDPAIQKTCQEQVTAGTTGLLQTDNSHGSVFMSGVVHPSSFLQTKSKQKNMSGASSSSISIGKQIRQKKSLPEATMDAIRSAFGKDKKISDNWSQVLSDLKSKRHENQGSVVQSSTSVARTSAQRDDTTTNIVSFNAMRGQNRLTTRNMNNGDYERDLATTDGRFLSSVKSHVQKNTSPIKLASSLLAGVSKKLHKPELQTFATKMLAQDVLTNIRALTFVEDQMQTSPDSTLGFASLHSAKLHKEDPTDCMAEMDSARAQVMEKLEKQREAKAAYLNVTSAENTLTGVIAQQNSANVVETDIMNSGKTLKDAVTVGCEALISPLTATNAETVPELSKMLDKYIVALYQSGSHVPYDFANSLHTLVSDYKSSLAQTLASVNEECDDIKLQSDNIGAILEMHIKGRTDSVEALSQEISDLAAEAEPRKTEYDEATTAFETAQANLQAVASKCGITQEDEGTALTEMKRTTDAKVGLEAVKFARTLLEA